MTKTTPDSCGTCGPCHAGTQCEFICPSERATVCEPELHLHVWSEGDPSVGLFGRSAEVVFHRDEACVTQREIEHMKATVKQVFEELWDDDVHVLTNREVAEEAAYEATFEDS